MQYIAKALLGVAGISNIVASTTVGPDGMWLKVLLAVVGFMATVTCLFYGQVLAHFNNHHKEKESIIKELIDYIDREMDQQKEMCELKFKKLNGTTEEESG